MYIKPNCVESLTKWLICPKVNFINHLLHKEDLHYAVLIFLIILFMNIV